MENLAKNSAPIVLCHGLFGSLSDLAKSTSFGERYVIAPDLLGYGEYRFVPIDELLLADQARHILSILDEEGIGKAHFIGHSVGGAVAAWISILHPERVISLVSVEGNMTPPDAFWSANLAQKSIEEIQELVNGYNADVAAWIGGAGVSATTETLRIATDWLSHQPAATLKAQAKAVVKATSDSSGFLKELTSLLANGLELHLIAGSNSRGDWHLPKAIESAAKTVTVLPARGHLMMLEAPDEFAAAVIDAIDSEKVSEL